MKKWPWCKPNKLRKHLELR